jgi:pentapeptide MXKDX repeat protein
MQRDSHALVNALASPLSFSRNELCRCLETLAGGWNRLPFSENVSRRSQQMTKRIALALSAATLSLGLMLAPAAFAQDNMKKDGMAKDTMSKDGMKKDTMSKDGMAKDGMAKDGMAKDGMKK